MQSESVDSAVNPANARPLSIVRRVIQSPGKPLTEYARRPFEAAFGKSFRDVRIHRDELAAESAYRLGAVAYAVGNHVVLGGQVSSLPPDCQVAIMAHELAHVLQQSQSSASGCWLRLGHPNSWFESEATAAASRVLVGLPAGRLTRESRGVVRCFPCPGEPVFSTTSAAAKEIYEPANSAIEAAYLLAKADHTDAIMFGSQFITRTDIQLPKGVPGKAYGNRLLSELRGIQAQLRPDIIDFEERVFYEIKTETSAVIAPAKVKAQLDQYYRLAEQIRIQFGGGVEPPWLTLHATWKPPHVLPLPGNVLDMIVCTEATDYTKWPSGLILYDVRRRNKDKLTRRKAKAISAAIFDPNFSGAFSNGMIFSAVAPYHPVYPGFVIIAPPSFVERWRRQVGEAKVAQQVQNLQVAPPFLNRRDPALQIRACGWAMIAGVGLGFAPLTIGTAMGLLAGAVPGAAVLMGGVSAGGGTVIPLFGASGAMSANAAVKGLAAAAGVLLVFATTSTAQGQTSFVVSDPGVARIVPIENFKPFNGVQTASSTGDVPGEFMHTLDTMKGQFELGGMVSYDSRMCTIIGQVAMQYGDPPA